MHDARGIGARLAAAVDAAAFDRAAQRVRMIGDPGLAAENRDRRAELDPHRALYTPLTSVVVRLAPGMQVATSAGSAKSGHTSATGDGIVISSESDGMAAANLKAIGRVLSRQAGGEAMNEDIRLGPRDRAERQQRRGSVVPARRARRGQRPFRAHADAGRHLARAHHRDGPHRRACARSTSSPAVGRTRSPMAAPPRASCRAMHSTRICARRSAHIAGVPGTSATQQHLRGVRPARHEAGDGDLALRRGGRRGRAPLLRRGRHRDGRRRPISASPTGSAWPSRARKRSSIWRSAPGTRTSDGIIIACLNFRSHPIIDELEARTGKPVVTSTQATLWHVLRLAGVETPIPGYGRLLREH